MIFSLLLLLLFVILPIAVIIMIITAIVKRSKNGDSSLKSFEKSIRSIYTYIVLICLLCTIIGGLIYLFNTGLDLVLPEKQNSSTYYDNTYITSIEMENINRIRNKNIVGVFTASAMLVSAVPLFIYYNKLAKKEN